jgi:hypothetical protein
MNTTSKLPCSAPLLWALGLVALLAWEAEAQNPVPSVTLDVPSSVRIGDPFTISATFVNTSSVTPAAANSAPLHTASPTTVALDHPESRLFVLTSSPIAL